MVLCMVVRVMSSRDDRDDGGDGKTDQEQSKENMATGAGIWLRLTGITGEGEHSNVPDSGEKEQNGRPEAESSAARRSNRTLRSWRQRGQRPLGFVWRRIRHKTFDAHPGNWFEGCWR